MPLTCFPSIKRMSRLPDSCAIRRVKHSPFCPIN
jgi:hypothetical protein